MRVGNAVVRGAAVVAILAVGVTWGVSAAKALTFTNGGFESGVAPGSFATVGTGDSTSITGWTVTSGSVDYIGSYWTPHSGDRSIDLDGNTQGTISQHITGFEIGANYKVVFWLAGNPDGGPEPKEGQLSVFAGNKLFNFNATGQTHDDMGWIQMSFIFTANSAETDLVFKSLTGTGAGIGGTCPCYGPALDDVNIFATDEAAPPGDTPLPAALPLFAGGLGVLGLMSRRRKKRIWQRPSKAEFSKSSDYLGFC